MNRFIKSIEFKGRMVILWKMPDGYSQPFYRSTGRNSNLPGMWFPFDGCSFRTGNPWFDKARFTPYAEGPLRRFGLQQYRKASHIIAGTAVPFGNVVEHGVEVNAFLVAQGWENPVGHPTSRNIRPQTTKEGRDR